MPDQKRIRPGRATGADQSDAGGITFRVPADADAFALALDGAFCVVVEVHPDKFRRRVFLSLSAAQRHVERARGRGQSARIVLARLSPAYVLSGTAQPELSGGAA